MDLPFVVVMVRDLADKGLQLRIIQVPVVHHGFRGVEPVFVPVLPVLLREGDRSAPGGVVGHGFRIGHQALPETEFTDIGFVCFEHGVPPTCMIYTFMAFSTLFRPYIRRSARSKTCRQLPSSPGRKTDRPLATTAPPVWRFASIRWLKASSSAYRFL